MKEIDKLRCMFSKNGYSSKFFYETLNTFLTDRYTPKHPPKDELDTKFLLKIPYFGKPSIEFKNKIKDLVSKHLMPVLCVCTVPLKLVATSHLNVGVRGTLLPTLSTNIHV